MKLLFVRHGDPDYSIDSLTETGWKEARLLAPRLSKLPVHTFYVSPLGRARDTLSFTLEQTGREAVILPWLREFPCHVRKPDDPSMDCTWDWLPGYWTKEPRFFDMESWHQVDAMVEAGVPEEYQHVCEAFDTLLAKHGYVRDGKLYRAERPNEDTLVFVCHFGLTCVLLSHLLNIPPMLLWHGTCAAPTSVTTVNTEERRKGIAYFRMSTFGDISHLYEAGQEPAFAARFCETFARADQRHD